MDTNEITNQSINNELPISLETITNEQSTTNDNLESQTLTTEVISNESNLTDEPIQFVINSEVNATNNTNEISNSVIPSTDPTIVPQNANPPTINSDSNAIPNKTTTIVNPPKINSTINTVITNQPTINTPTNNREETIQQIGTIDQSSVYNTMAIDPNLNQQIVPQYFIPSGSVPIILPSTTVIGNHHNNIAYITNGPAFNIQGKQNGIAPIGIINNATNVRTSSIPIVMVPNVQPPISNPNVQKIVTTNQTKPNGTQNVIGNVQTLPLSFQAPNNIIQNQQLKPSIISTMQSNPPVHHVIQGNVAPIQFAISDRNPNGTYSLVPIIHGAHNPQLFQQVIPNNSNLIKISNSRIHEHHKKTEKFKIITPPVTVPNNPPPPAPPIPRTPSESEGDRIISDEEKMEIARALLRLSTTTPGVSVSIKPSRRLRTTSAQVIPEILCSAPYKYILEVIFPDHVVPNHKTQPLDIYLCSQNGQRYLRGMSISLQKSETTDGVVRQLYLIQFQITSFKNKGLKFTFHIDRIFSSTPFKLVARKQQSQNDFWDQHISSKDSLNDEDEQFDDLSETDNSSSLSIKKEINTNNKTIENSSIENNKEKINNINSINNGIINEETLKRKREEIENSSTNSNIDSTETKRAKITDSSETLSIDNSLNPANNNSTEPKSILSINQTESENIRTIPISDLSRIRSIKTPEISKIKIFENPDSKKNKTEESSESRNQLLISKELNKSNEIPEHRYYRPEESIFPTLLENDLKEKLVSLNNRGTSTFSLDSKKRKENTFKKKIHFPDKLIPLNHPNISNPIRTNFQIHYSTYPSSIPNPISTQNSTPNTNSIPSGIPNIPIHLPNLPNNNSPPIQSNLPIQQNQ